MFRRYKYQLIVKLGNFIEKIYNTYQFHKLRQNKSISIGKNVYIHPSARIEILNGGTVSIGDNTTIMNGVLIITYGGKVEIGKNCQFEPYSIIYGLGGAIIGDDLLMAGHSMVVPDNHIFEDLNRPINSQGTKKLGIKINNNVWIGHGCSILDGVEIESGAIIAAGSVVNKNV